MKFYGQFEIPVDRFLYERYFPEIGIRGTFVECGAFDGLTECSCRFFEETMGWSGYNLEPVPWIFEQLQANRPESQNLNVGLSDRVDTLPFYAVNHPTFARNTTIGSIQHDPRLKELLTAQGCTFDEIAIDVINWSEFIERTAIRQVDLMVLDVEGHEMAVLAGMRNSPVLPSVMCVEFGHVGFEKLRTAMEELGYAYDIHSYANAFFVRQDLLALFALRRAARLNGAPKDENDDGECRDLLAQVDEIRTELARNAKALDELQRDNRALRQREAELVALLDAMTSSKGWRALELAKRAWLTLRRLR